MHSIAFNPSEIFRMLDHIPLGILVLDSDYRVLFWNKCLEYWTGLNEEQINGQDIRQRYPLFAEKRFASRIETIFQGGPPIIFSSHIHKRLIPAPLPNGALRLQHVTVSPLRREDGRFLGMFAIQDVTEVNTRLIQRKKAEKDLLRVLSSLEETNKKLEDSSRLAEQKAREAEQATRSKSEFLANMSHEIRTPMSGILGALSMLASTEQDGEKLNMLRMTKDSAQSLLKIINDILDLSKVEAGKLELNPEDCELRPLLERVWKLYSVPAQAKGLRLELSLKPDLPATVRLDATKLEQVLRNLLDNAVKFTNQGRIVLKAEVVETRPDVAHVRFLVQDSGVGIPEQAMSRLFQPFSQVDSSYAKTFGGTGLGLAICKRLTELMGGVMDVQSKPWQGSAFSFTLPLPLPQTRRQPEPALRESASWSFTPSGRALRVLAAEDDRLNQKYLAFILAGQGFQADIVSSGREAVEAFQRTPYDIVLMDIQMPEMDGLEATRRIRAFEVHGSRFSGSAVGRTEVHGSRFSGSAVGRTEVQGSRFNGSAVGRTEVHGSGFSGSAVEGEGVHGSRFSGSAVGEVVNGDVAVGAKNLSPNGVAPSATHSGASPAPTVNREQLNREPYDREPSSTVNSEPYDSEPPNREPLNREPLNQRKRKRERERIPIIALTAYAMTEQKKQFLAAGMDGFVSKPIDEEELFREMARVLPDSLGQEDAGPAGSLRDKPCVDEPPLFNRQEIERRYDGNLAFWGEMRNMFVNEELPKYIQTLTDSVDSGRVKEIADTAHRLKGALGTVCAQGAYEMAARLDRIAQEGMSERLGQAAQDLLAELKRLEISEE